MPFFLHSYFTIYTFSKKTFLEEKLYAEHINQILLLSVNILFLKVSTYFDYYRLLFLMYLFL